uniref:HIT-type domain-containing protein n=1 Tax=Salix viminalis TaxID=40686 RepID=A0A6N2KPW4_SALVM
MEDDVSNPFRRMLMRTRKIAPKMVVALASNDNKTQAAIARLEALENDYTGMETVEAVYDDEASLDDDALPPYVPSYMRPTMGPPSSTCSGHFCIVCEFTSNYTCAKCGMRFCSIRRYMMIPLPEIFGLIGQT